MRAIKEQTILITGATSGLGKELAQALAKQGATVLLHGRDVVLEAGWKTMSSVEEGLVATLRLVVDPTLENVSGEYFDGLTLSKANPQAYDRKVQERLEALSSEIVARDISRGP